VADELNHPVKGGSFALEWVATFPWNGWQHWRGLGGNLRLEYAKPLNHINKVWIRLRKKAELPDLRVHDLRHQYASFLVNAGRSLYEVQQVLGHSAPIVTQRYAHLSSKTLQEAASTASDRITAALEAS
ncbi:MAG: tyrosine-type recombinase/integrase, partial [Halieaceae bacterium]|nr:tyrosine-type recombinase/integrase [Halieaceae bacterium]